jgi:hypothetical protein
MKFLVLSDLHLRETRAGKIKNNGRGVGAYYVTQEARKIGIDCCNIDYFLDWPRDLLVKCILSYFKDEKECLIGYSGSIDASGTDFYKELVKELQQDIPQLKVMLGGFREPQGDSDWVDILLIGRCTNILLDYLQGKDISKYQVFDNPPGYKNPAGVIIEPPVYNILREDDFWSPNELLTIETALGCKFNCSFCGYDYRNNKNPTLNGIDRLVETMQTAYDVAGITNFFLADDTINEVDDKLLLLGEVKKQLTFEPWLMAFVRIDIMGAKTHQIDLLREANILSHFYGIETLNPTITKIIRKGGKPERNYDTMRLVKKEFPEAFTYGNFIIGLTGDSKKDIWDTAKLICDEQLLTAGGTTALRLYSQLQNDEIKSEMDKDPAKYGYTILEQKNISWDKIGYESDNWQNDWINRTDASILNHQVDAYYRDNLPSLYTAHDYAMMKTLIPNVPIPQYNHMMMFAQGVQNSMMNQYISNKSKSML